MTPKIRVVVDLNDEQSAWLRREAIRTGLDYISLVEDLIDERVRNAAPTNNQE